MSPVLHSLTRRTTPHSWGYFVRPLGLASGYLLDRLLADPPRYHPVAAFGRAAQWLEARLYQPTRARGGLYYLLAAGTPTLLGALAARVLRRTYHPLLHTLLLAGATWSVLGGTSLQRVGEEMWERLHRDPAAARELIPSLCARDPQYLDEADMVRATVESLAENTSDATVAALCWGMIAGLPGVIFYRTTNTLDAMVGYRSERYQHFGWVSAKADDWANYLPARFTALLTALLSGSRALSVFRIVLRDAPHHPSPNAGVVEASAAAALGVTLGGSTVYDYGVEERPRLGEGPLPTLDDLPRTVALSGRLQHSAAVVAVLAATGWALHLRDR